jgi:hypothetical protein
MHNHCNGVPKVSHGFHRRLWAMENRPVNSGGAIALQVIMQFKLVPVIAMFALSMVSLAAQEDRATVQLRDGTTVEGRIEALGQGTLFLRVSQADQRRIPISSVALIDRKGAAAGLPDTEVNEARNAEHLLLLTSGSSVKGQLVQIRGGEGSGDEGPRTYVFRTAAGEERTYPPEQVARIYMGMYPFAATAHGALAAPAHGPAGALRVPPTAGWVATGLTVRKGDLVSFDTSGEVQLSDNGADRAKSTGTTRAAPLAPLPTVNAGALIGRIGNSGKPFGVGDQASVPMPDDGMLYLAVNDDERGDNAGEFIVVVSRR